MQTSVAGRPMEILLVEDSLVYARFTMEALKRGHVCHRLTLVFDGEEAVAFLRREGRYARAPRPDLVLLDLGLPKKDGWEVLREIRQDPDLGDLPVVIVTSSDDQADIAASEALGVDAYITKPVNLDKFLTLVKKLKHSWHDIALPTV